MRRPLATLVLPAALVGLVIAGWLSVSPSSRNTTGHVRDDNGPVSGAVVRFKGTSDSTTSDDRGRFRLPAGTAPAARRVTAWKSGYFIAGSPLDADPLQLTLQPLPLHDNRDYQWVDPAPDPRGEHNCANCHQEIYREW